MVRIRRGSERSSYGDGVAGEVSRIEGVTRVQRTFGFVDVSGFTAFTDLHGDAAAVEVLEHSRGLIRRYASVYGVRVAKWLGDGAMIVGVHPEPTIEALVDIVDEANRRENAPRLRAGVAVGDVIMFEGDDHIGQAVNLASRLADLAKAGEILAPATINSPLLVNTVLVPHGQHTVPGIKVPLEIARLERRV
ncbi:MAG: adenylate/guanylate cyclase domain-containing protein [Acidimicrobiales bacterium]|nr:MAG: adenylate/guanylate cyclase domain-containing protein [Acidimicrobiales bacterium]